MLCGILKAYRYIINQFVKVSNSHHNTLWFTIAVLYFFQCEKPINHSKHDSVLLRRGLTPMFLMFLKFPGIQSKDNNNCVFGYLTQVMSYVYSIHVIPLFMPCISLTMYGYNLDLPIQP